MHLQLILLVLLLTDACMSCQPANFDFVGYAVQRKGDILDTLYLGRDGSALQQESTYMIDPSTGTFSLSIGNWYTHSCNGDYIKFVGVGTAAAGNPQNVTNNERLEIVLKIVTDTSLLVVNSTVFEVPFTQNIFKSNSNPERLESDYIYVRVPYTTQDAYVQPEEEDIYRRSSKYSGHRK